MLEKLWSVPGIGRLLVAAVVWATTRAVYGRDADRFARRHARAGGTAYRYVLSWAVPGNRFGSAHGIDLALLFGRRQTWGDGAMMAGAAWDEVDRAGQDLRALWADFARGADLPDTLTLPGLLTVQRYVP